MRGVSTKGPLTLNDAFFITNQRKENTFWTTPPPLQKKAQGYQRSRTWIAYTHMCLFIPAAYNLEFY